MKRTELRSLLRFELLALGLALVVAMPLVAISDGPTQLVLHFAPVEGAIGYKARVRTADETVYYVSNYGGRPVKDWVVIPVLPQEPYQIDVAAYDTNGRLGEWSEPLWEPMDFNRDGVVGISDLGYLLAHWPQYGMAGWKELSAHWGQQVELQPDGLRRYVEVSK